MSQEIHEHLGRLSAEVALLKDRLERTVRHGTVTDVDYSDPTKPRARIQIGVKADGSPLSGPWAPIGTMAGDLNEWHPVVVGQQLTQLAPDGDHQQAVLVHLGHSSKTPSPETDKDTHVSAFGKTKRTLKKDSLTTTVGGTQVNQTDQDHKVTAPGKIELTAGDPSAANSSGFGSLQNAPHELNRIVQGFAARLDQHDHLHAAHHDQMSQIVDLAVPKVPALIALQSTTLNHKPEGLQMAAEQVMGQVPQYASNIIGQAVSKLLASPLQAGAGATQPDIGGMIGPLIGQLGSMIGAGGLSGGQAATAQMLLGQVQAGAQAAAAGGTADISSALSSVASLLSSTPMAGPIGDIIGQIQAALSQTTGLLGGLSGLLDGQVNASKGTIKSALFGGYGS